MGPNTARLINELSKDAIVQLGLANYETAQQVLDDMPQDLREKLRVMSEDLVAKIASVGVKAYAAAYPDRLLPDQEEMAAFVADEISAPSFKPEGVYAKEFCAILFVSMARDMGIPNPENPDSVLKVVGPANYGAMIDAVTRRAGRILSKIREGAAGIPWPGDEYIFYKLCLQFTKRKTDAGTERTQAN